MTKYQLPKSITHDDWLAMSEDNKRWFDKAADWCHLHPYVIFNMDHPANKGRAHSDLVREIKGKF